MSPNIGLKTVPTNDWRASQGQEQTSTPMPCGLHSLPVAQFGAHAGGGLSGSGSPKEQITSTRMTLGRNPSTYDPVLKTKPEIPLKGKYSAAPPRLYPRVDRPSRARRRAVGFHGERDRATEPGMQIVQQIQSKIQEQEAWLQDVMGC